MYKILKSEKFIKGYVKILLYFALLTFLNVFFFKINSLPGPDDSIYYYLITFTVFSFLVFKLCLKSVKSEGKEGIYALFISVPLSIFYIPYTIAIHDFFYSLKNS